MLGDDNSVWGRGWKIQGEDEKSKWAKLELPSSCKNVKKLAVGKFNRVVLDDDGKLFF